MRTCERINLPKVMDKVDFRPEDLDLKKFTESIDLKDFKSKVECGTADFASRMCRTALWHTERAWTKLFVKFKNLIRTGSLSFTIYRFHPGTKKMLVLQNGYGVLIEKHSIMLSTNLEIQWIATFLSPDETFDYLELNEVTACQTKSIFGHEESMDWEDYEDFIKGEANEKQMA